MRDDRGSIERTFLSRERNALSEERTILAYIRTELALVGVIILVMRFYFYDRPWQALVSFVVMGFFAVLVVLELKRIRDLRLYRRKLQRMHKHLKWK